jgi:hypothetical protein
MDTTTALERFAALPDDDALAPSVVAPRANTTPLDAAQADVRRLGALA